VSVPLIETISEHIKTTIASATAANQAGNQQAFVAVRPNRLQFVQTAWDDLTVLIDRMDAEEGKGGYGAKEWRQYFGLSAFVIDSDSATTSIDTRLNEVEASIIKKLLEDTSRGGKAINTHWHASTPFVDEQGRMSGILIMISVDYRTAGNDPYTPM
jgi:hypothetical protein